MALLLSLLEGQQVFPGGHRLESGHRFRFISSRVFFKILIRGKSNFRCCYVSFFRQICIKHLHCDDHPVLFSNTTFSIRRASTTEFWAGHNDLPETMWAACLCSFAALSFRCRATIRLNNKKVCMVWEMITSSVIGS